MYTKTIIAIVCSVAFCCISTAYGFQEVTTSKSVSSPRTTSINPPSTGYRKQVLSTGLTSSSDSASRFFLLSKENRETDRAIGDAAKALRQAATSSERDDAKKELESLLSTDYDNRLQSYEDYLNELEKKLANMRNKLAKRREAKQEMIQLRVKVLESEADDLGWPERMSGGRFPTGLRATVEGPGWGVVK